MKLSEARIGYAGYSRDFGAPGDRRRFAAFARLKGIPIEYAELSRDYDVAYVTYSSDLPGWIARKERDGKRLKLIFELIDAYFTESGLARRYLKGLGRYALGTDSRLSVDLRQTMVRACKVADAVVCSTEEQRETIRQFNPNVFISFDHFGDELGPPKSDYARLGKLRIVWEGQSTTLPNLQVIREPLNDLRDQIQLHVVTDPAVHGYFGRYGGRDSREMLRGIECPIHFHPWTRQTFARHVAVADAAVIPIELSNAMARGKPENKLVMMWKLGMPVLASATSAYRRAMDKAGIDMSCATLEDWTTHLQWLIDANASKLARIGRQCRQFAEQAYSGPEFVKPFDRAFEAIGLSTD